MNEMQAKDLPDAPFLAMIARITTEHGAPATTFRIRMAIPRIPPKVVKAKLVKLISRGLMTGCPCGGCPGHFHVTEAGGAVIAHARAGEAQDAADAELQRQGSVAFVVKETDPDPRPTASAGCKVEFVPPPWSGPGLVYGEEPTYRVRVVQAGSTIHGWRDTPVRVNVPCYLVPQADYVVSRGGQGLARREK